MADTRTPAELHAEPPELGADERRAELEQARRLAERYRLEFVDMDTFRIDQELFRSIPADLMLRYGFVPYRREGKTLSIVVSDPTDLPMIDELACCSSTPIKVAVGPRSAIESILKKSESSQRVLEEATESFQLQLLKEEENGDDSLTVERLTSDISPVIRLVDSTIYTAIQRRASDIHIETQDDAVHVKYRIDGVLQPAMRPIAKQFHSSIISRIKVMAELDIAEKRVPQDGRFKLRMPGKTIDFRVSIMPSVHGEDAVIRILDKESISEQFTELRLDILGFPGGRAEALPQVHRRAVRHGARHRADRQRQDDDALRGALGDQVVEDKIITIEDPVEYQLRGITQIPINEKKGLTFARGLRSILRHDPDKIMVGEIRDNETAQIAINSALTGHLVFTTVHANNVLDVLGRFLNMGVEAYQFVSALNCVLAQRLVRVICTHCKRPAKVTRALLEESGLDPALEHTHTFYEGVGCIECNGTGYKGRMAICELLDLTRSHPRDDSREAADVGDQEGGARRRHAVPARVGRRARARRADDAARNQQGDVRRMSRFSFSLRDAAPPAVAVEIAGAPRVRPPGSSMRGGRPVVAAHAAEPLPDGALVPSLTAANVRDRAAVRPRVDERARAASAGRGASGSSCRIRSRRSRWCVPAGAGARAGSRSADPLAGAEGRAVSDRGGAGQLRAGGARPPTARSSSSSLARRDVVAEYEALCADAGAHAGLVDLSTFNVINAVLGGSRRRAATGCSSTSRPTARRSRSCAAAT